MGTTAKSMMGPRAVRWGDGEQGGVTAVNAVVVGDGNSGEVRDPFERSEMGSERRDRCGHGRQHG